MTLDLLPASESWSLERVESGEGMGVALTLADRVGSVVERKTEKLQKGRRATQYHRWWLVLDDDILIVPNGVLSLEERRGVERRVRQCSGRERWSKVVLVSRFQPTRPPPKTPKPFWALWEHPADSSLPQS